MILKQLQDCSVDAATYFQLHQVHFFAASGLIRIDLPLLLSVSSGKNRSPVEIPEVFVGRDKDRETVTVARTPRREYFENNLYYFNLDKGRAPRRRRRFETGEPIIHSSDLIAKYRNSLSALK